MRNFILLYLPPPTPYFLKRIVCTVTNDLSYDQRMQRICSSLANNGFEVLLVGRKRPNSVALTQMPFEQKRLYCFFDKGFAFYAEYNLRLFFFLLFTRAAILCAIDLDTILPVYFSSVLRKRQRVYDAHELFTEQKEIVTRPRVQKIWLAIEKFAVPRFKHGYTVNQFIVDELHRRYGVAYGMVRNLPVTYGDNSPGDTNLQLPAIPWIIYQGAVNEGRSFETFIPAMQWVNAPLLIYGDGNFFEQTRQLIHQYKLENKVLLKGYTKPALLKQITPHASIAVTVFEQTGLNQYYSLSNRFFDYIMSCVPQVCVNYPEYQAINDQHGIALMIDDTKAETIAAALNKLLEDTVLYRTIKNNCLKARTLFNWEREEQTLLRFYRELAK